MQNMKQGAPTSLVINMYRQRTSPKNPLSSKTEVAQTFYIMYLGS